MSISGRSLSTVYPLVAPPPLAIDAEEGALLVRLALAALEAHLKGEERPSEPPPAGPLSTSASAFVSVYAGDHLRGCLGVLHSREPLWRGVQEIAVHAASRDPRFEPMRDDELTFLSVEISVLGPMAEVPPAQRETLPASLRLGEHGLAVRHRGKSGLLLPQVPERHGWGARRFLEEACRKALLPEGTWKDPQVKLSVFRCAVFKGDLGPSETRGGKARHPPGGPGGAAPEGPLPGGPGPARRGPG